MVAYANGVKQLESGSTILASAGRPLPCRCSFQAQAQSRTFMFKTKQETAIGMMELWNWHDAFDICWHLSTYVDALHGTPEGGFAMAYNGLQTTWQKQDGIHNRLRNEKDAYLAQLEMAWIRLWASSGCIRLQGPRLSSSQVAGRHGLSCSGMLGLASLVQCQTAMLCARTFHFSQTNPNNASSWEPLGSGKICKTECVEDGATWYINVCRYYMIL